MARQRLSVTRARHLAVVFALSTLLLCETRVQAQSAAQPAASAAPQNVLRQEADAIVAAHHGKVAVWAAQFDEHGRLREGRALRLDSDREVQTASCIKLAILYEAMVAVREGRAHWDEKITLPKGEAVGGSGMLHFFDGPMTLTLKDVLTIMVIVSDNTATNLAIDRFGIDAVNNRLLLLGLTHTHLYKKVFKPATGPLPADQPKFGLGKTTPNEIAQLMMRIGACRLRPVMDQAFSAPRGVALQPPDDADKAVCDVTLTMLKSQFYRETIPRYLPNGGDQTVASKTGSLDAVRNDVAIVAGKSGPIVLAIFTYENTDHSWTVDNEGEMTVAKLAKAIVSAWSPEGLDPKVLVPGFALSAK